MQALSAYVKQIEAWSFSVSGTMGRTKGRIDSLENELERNALVSPIDQGSRTPLDGIRRT